jgi:hypothetical protein
MFLDDAVFPDYIFHPVLDPARELYIVPQGVAVSARVRNMTWTEEGPRCNVCGLLIAEHRLFGDEGPPPNIVYISVQRFLRTIVK